MDFRIHNIKSILSWDPIQDKLVCKDDKEIFISNGVIKNIDNKVNFVRIPRSSTKSMPKIQIQPLSQTPTSFMLLMF